MGANATLARAEGPGGKDAFVFHMPEEFVDARSAHGLALEPRWSERFCAEDGVTACAFSGAFEADGSRAFAYVKLAPGSQPVGETLLSRLARSIERAAYDDGTRVEVVERSLDDVRGHPVGRILARVTAGNRATLRWMWVMATADDVAMLTYVAPAESFGAWRAGFEASARRTEGIVDGEPLLRRALAKTHAEKNAKVVLVMLVAALILKVVFQASSRRQKLVVELEDRQPENTAPGKAGPGRAKK